MIRSLESEQSPLIPRMNRLMNHSYGRILMSSTSTTLPAWPTVDTATPGQVEFYRDQGYLKFSRIFTQAEMIAALPPGARPEEMDRPHFTDPWLFRYLTHPRALDVIEDFIGPDIALWS